ncbi:hypothetical protein BD769DRAFT_1675383 [Suillus cothurnatus]|nr:hypothetical protein BD769DRAFT_1675383 [Suillus cothurnatus]
MFGLALMSPLKQLRPLTTGTSIEYSTNYTWVKAFCGPSTWNAFCWKTRIKENGPFGKAVLSELINEHCIEYHTFSKDEKDSLLKEYEEHKATKTNGARISMKLKINNVTQTIKAIENELNSLRCRTGAEMILYTTCGSTDLPLRGIAFAMEGVDDFMESVMNVDNQEFVSKMEGFAFHGICGAAKNHQNTALICTITNNLKATIQWVHYWCNVISHYQVATKGWPDEIPFDNLSKASSGIPALEDLRKRWKSGETTWRQVDDKELQELIKEQKGKLNCGKLVEHRHWPHSDKGKKWHHAFSPNENLTSKPHKKAAYMSPTTVDSENEMDSTLISSQNITINTVPLVDTPPAFNSTPLINTPPSFNSMPLINTPPALNSVILINTHLAFNSAPLIDTPVIQEPTTSFDVPFHPLVSLSSGSADFIDFPFTAFEYEAAVVNLNELLSGPALT